MRGGQAVTLAPRRVVGLDGDWKDTVIELPAGSWKNVFTGELFSSGTQELSRMFTQFPVGLLVTGGIL